MFVVSGFCMADVTYVLVGGLDTAPADTSVMMSFLTLVGIVGAYVFGAVWEDTTVAKIAGRSTRRRNRPPEIEEEEDNSL